MIDTSIAVGISLIGLGVFFFYAAGGQPSSLSVMAVGLGFLVFVVGSWAWMAGAG